MAIDSLTIATPLAGIAVTVTPLADIVATVTPLAGIVATINPALVTVGGGGGATDALLASLATGWDDALTWADTETWTEA